MLYEKICEDDFDMDRFKYMIELREQIHKKQQTVESASMEVGQRLFNIYVKPIVDKNTDTS